MAAAPKLESGRKVGTAYILLSEEEYEYVAQYTSSRTIENTHLFTKSINSSELLYSRSWAFVYFILYKCVIILHKV